MSVLSNRGLGMESASVMRATAGSGLPVRRGHGLLLERKRGYDSLLDSDNQK